MQFENVERLINEEINDNKISGARICFIRDNNVLLDETYGMMNIEQGKVMCKDAIFRLYSLSKPVAAVACMILYERGLLDLYSPVSDYLDGFRNQKVFTKEGLVNVNRDINIMDLLSMTSGLMYPDEDEASIEMNSLFSKEQEEIKKGYGSSTQELCNKIGEVPLAFQPGTKWRYGASADVLGAVMEKVYGDSLGELYRREIFEPLQMADTGFYVPKEKQDRFAKLYLQKGENGQSVLKQDEDRHLCLSDCLKSPAFESAGAGLVSTIEDYSKFAIMLANSGNYKGVKILDRKTVDFMTTNQLSNAQIGDMDWAHLKGYGYGFFMRILLDPIKAAYNGSLGEFGWDGWSGPHVSIDRKEKTVFLFMVQTSAYSNQPLIKKLNTILNSQI